MESRNNFKKPGNISGNTATTIIVNPKITIQIISITDSPVRKTITANIVEKPYNLVLWKDSSYDSIGQWTDTDVETRIKEFYK